MSADVNISFYNIELSK